MTILLLIIPYRLFFYYYCYYYFFFLVPLSFLKYFHFKQVTWRNKLCNAMHATFKWSYSPIYFMEYSSSLVYVFALSTLLRSVPAVSVCRPLHQRRHSYVLYAHEKKIFVNIGENTVLIFCFLMETANITKKKRSPLGYTKDWVLHKGISCEDVEYRDKGKNKRCLHRNA